MTNMIKKILLTALWITGIMIPLSGKDTTLPGEPKKKVIIYNFISTSAEAKYQFYSQVIPLTIAKSLGSSPQFDVKYINENIDGAESKTEKKISTETKKKSDKTAGSSERIAQDEIKSLEKLYEKRMRDILERIKKILESSKDDLPGYLITGSYTVSQNALELIIDIYNVKGKKLTRIHKKSIEVGALLKDTTDDITTKIENQLTVFEDDNKKLFNQSPFIPLYKRLSHVTIGFNYGELYFIKNYSNDFKNTRFISTYLLLHVTEILGASLDLEHFGTSRKQSDGIGNTYDQEFSLWAGLINFHLTGRLSRLMGISLACGYGIVNARWEDMPPGSGGLNNQGKINNTPHGKYIKLSASMDFDIRPVLFTFGGSFDTLIYPLKNLFMYTVFAGVGYRI